MKDKDKFIDLPPLIRWIIKLLFKDDGDTRMGDFVEIYNNYVEEKGKLKARFWLYSYLIKSIPQYFKDSSTSGLTMVKYNLVISLRNLRRERLTSIINILGLAIGMTCFLLIVLWVMDEKSYDKFHENKDNLYLLTITHPNDIVDYNVPYAIAPLMSDEFPEIRNYTRVYKYSNRVTSFFRYMTQKGSPTMFNESNVNLVDKGFFSMFSFPFKQGNPDTALKLENSVVITDEIAAKYFGKEPALGKVLTLNNQRNLTVTGVIHIPDNSHLHLDFVIPLRSRLDKDWNWSDQSFVFLDPNTSLPTFKEKIAGFFDKVYPYFKDQTFTLGLFPMTEVHLGFGRQIYVTIFSLLAVFIMLIACINYINLTTAQSVKRSREVGLKKVMGARRLQLIQQFLKESIFVSIFAYLIALILVPILLPLINTLTGKQLSLNLLQDFILVLYLLGLMMVVGLVAGIYPAIFLTRQNPVDAFKPVSVRTSGHSVFRIITVVGQFTISLLLIICTAFVFKQLHYIRNRPLGITVKNIIKIPLNRGVLQSFNSYKNTLEQNPKIISITMGQTIPFNEDYKTSGIDWDGKDSNTTANVRYTVSYLDYLETFGMEIIKGRSFKKDYSDLNNYVINEKAVAYMDMTDPIGQRLKFWGIEGKIIGVIKDYHHVPLRREIMPHIFVINPRSYRNLKFIFIKIAAQNIPETLSFIREKTVAMAPNYPYSYTFLDQGMAELYQSERNLGEIFSYFAFLAIFISCLGIFALASYTSQQKTKEIGIRKVMGSSIRGVVLHLSKSFFRWILLANIIAWPIGYLAMHRWLENFAYRTNLSLFIFITAGILALVFAAIPVLSQSIKAALANPVDTLRYE